MRVIPAAWVLILWASTVCAQTQATYLYRLSSFSGPLRQDGLRVNVDRERDETLVLYQNLVRIFSPSGMEVFSFGDGLEVGHIVDVAVDRNGDVILLSYADSRTLVTRCNFRGEPVGPFDIRDLPAGVAFDANRMVYRNGLFYFASFATMRVIVTDSDGQFRQHLEFSQILGADERQTGGLEMGGFTVDREGNIFFTVATLFRVFKFSTEGLLSSFGRPGSAPGRFGIVAGIATDSRGNLLVADKLRSVVMIFDGDFQFLSEFGYRGFRPENLIVPDEVAVDGKDRVYVSQGRRRGVSVFALTGH